MKLFLLTVFSLFSLTIFSQTPIGLWKTVDDETQEEKSNVEIYEQNGKIYGKITKLLLNDGDPLCEKCSGAKKNKPILGMVIIEDLQAQGDYWKKGKILDPERGGIFGCSIWFEDGKPDELKVRARHWTGFYATQTWLRVKSAN